MADTIPSARECATFSELLEVYLDQRNRLGVTVGYPKLHQECLAEIAEAGRRMDEMITKRSSVAKV